MSHFSSLVAFIKRRAEGEILKSGGLLLTLLLTACGDPKFAVFQKSDRVADRIESALEAKSDIGTRAIGSEGLNSCQKKLLNATLAAIGKANLEMTTAYGVIGCARYQYLALNQRPEALMNCSKRRMFDSLLDQAIKSPACAGIERQPLEQIIPTLERIIQPMSSCPQNSLGCLAPETKAKKGVKFARKRMATIHKAIAIKLEDEIVASLKGKQPALSILAQYLRDLGLVEELYQSVNGAFDLAVIDITKLIKEAKPPAGVVCESVIFKQGIVSHPKVTVGQDFEVHCQYDKVIDSISVAGEGVECSLVESMGTMAAFRCKAKTIGNHMISCAVREGTNSNTCGQVNPIQNLEVISDIQVEVDRTNKGYLNGAALQDDGSIRVTGWACASNHSESIEVQLAAGKSLADGGSLLVQAKADVASEEMISKMCSSTGRNHNFDIVIPADVAKTYGGKALYVHGINPFGLGDTVIGNSGNVLLPVPVAKGPPDLVATTFKTSPESPAIGDSVTMTLTVKNQGTGVVAAGALVSVKFWVDGEELSVGSLALPSSLEPGQTVDLSPIAWTASAGTHRLNAEIDHQKQIEESDENNNEISRLLVVANPAAVELIAQVINVSGLINSRSFGVSMETQQAHVGESGAIYVAALVPGTPTNTLYYLNSNRQWVKDDGFKIPPAFVMTGSLPAKFEAMIQINADLRSFIGTECYISYGLGNEPHKDMRQANRFKMFYKVAE